MERHLIILLNIFLALERLIYRIRTKIFYIKTNNILSLTKNYFKLQQKFMLSKNFEEKVCLKN